MEHSEGSDRMIVRALRLNISPFLCLLDKREAVPTNSQQHGSPGKTCMVQTQYTILDGGSLTKTYSSM